mgnify:CR=1 FL=1
MAVDLRLKNRTDQVFSDYTEKFVGNSIVFEGCLLPHKIEARDKQIIRFVSGGRRYIGYELKRDGAYVRGVIRYRPLEKANPGNIALSMAKFDASIGSEAKKRPHKRAVSDSNVEEIRGLSKQGFSKKDIAKKFKIHPTTVYNIVNNKGAYAE